MKSKYGDKEMSPHQYLAEIMCEKIAAKDGKALPFKFWSMPEWTKTFVFQAVAASRLLKEYDLTTISRAINHPKAFRVYSLAAKKMLGPALQAAKQGEVAEPTIQLTAEQSSAIVNSTPSVRIVKKNLLGELDD